MGQVSPPIDFDGLRITAVPQDGVGPVLLTGSPYTMRVRIQSLSGNPRKGRLTFTWIVADQQSSPLTATFGVSTSAPTEFVIPDWRPTRAGYAELRVHLYIARVGGTVE